MELWPTRSRAWLAGLIGAASNVGFVLVALMGLGLSQLLTEVRVLLAGLGLEAASVDRLTANSGWRLLMASGALPAVLTFFIRLFVPELERWCNERSRGATRQWSTRDLLAVVLGAATALGMIALWAVEHPLGIAQPLAFQVVATRAGLAITYLGYTFPLRMYLRREGQRAGFDERWRPARVQRRLMIGAALSGVALLGTWASIQQAPSWAGQLAASAAVLQNASAAEVDRAAGTARAWTQISSGLGAIVGTIGATLLGSWIGRRLSYAGLCIASLASSLLFFQWNTSFDAPFLAMIFLAGGLTASFYGWFPLYLPELFPTRIRALAQGLAFNFGRILAAIGALQFGYLMNNTFDGSFSTTCSLLSLIYLLGLPIIWFAPETHNGALPE